MKHIIFTLIMVGIAYLSSCKMQVAANHYTSIHHKKAIEYQAQLRERGGMTGSVKEERFITK